MSHKIGLISDVHASPGALASALEVFSQHRVDDIICAGDIAGYYDDLPATIELLEQAQCRTIVGNHDQEYLQTHRNQSPTKEYRFLDALPSKLLLTRAKSKIYCVHAEPPAAQHGGIKLLDPQGMVVQKQRALWQRKLRNLAADVLIVGHTHQVFAERLGNLLVINPGSSVFNHSCMILDLPQMQVETYPLEKQKIIRCWNFSMLYGSQTPIPPAHDEKP